jgi:hypothetical protein
MRQGLAIAGRRTRQITRLMVLKALGEQRGRRRVRRISVASSRVGL